MKNRQILHIAHDEKFINAAYYLFEEAFPGSNTFVIVKPPANPPTKYLNHQLQAHAQFEVRNADTFDKLLKMSNGYAVTVLHGLNNLKAAVFSASSYKERFMSIIYGAEIYNGNVLANDYIGPKTKPIYNSSRRNSILTRIRDLYKEIRYDQREEVRNIEIQKVLFEMKVFGSLPSFSYRKFIDKGLYNPSVQKIPFSYYPLEFIVKDRQLRATGSDILLGNSASATNNHLEAFDLLQKKDLSGRTVYTPLSYGRKKYAKAVASYGKKLLPNNFKALTSFLPIEEYNKIISRCGIVIMNHYRPQAMGNIIASLYLGAKVFLNDTDAYQYYKHELGCHIYLLDEDWRDDSALDLLDEEQVKHNREILREELSTSILVGKMQSSFSRIFDFTTNQEVMS